MIHGFTPCGVLGTESELSARKAVALTAVLSPALGASIFFFKFLPLRPLATARQPRGEVTWLILPLLRCFMATRSRKNLPSWLGKVTSASVGKRGTPGQPMGEAATVQQSDSTQCLPLSPQPLGTCPSAPHSGATCPLPFPAQLLP